MADLTRGTGRFNAIAGAIVVAAGYGAAFLTLAGVAAAAFLFFTLLMPETGPSGERAARPALA